MNEIAVVLRLAFHDLINIRISFSSVICVDYSMVNFIKPSFLGTEKEFANLYGNPIKTGQHKDSSKSEIKVMKQRSYVLHKKLSKFVQVSCWIILILYSVRLFYTFYYNNSDCSICF